MEIGGVGEEGGPGEHGGEKGGEHMWRDPYIDFTTITLI